MRNYSAILLQLPEQTLHYIQCCQSFWEILQAATFSINNINTEWFILFPWWKSECVRFSFVGTPYLWQLLNCFPSLFITCYHLVPSHYLYCYHPGQSLSSLVLLETPHEGLFAPVLPSSACFWHSSLSERSKKKSSPVTPLLKTLPWLPFTHSKIQSIDQALHDPFAPVCPPTPLLFLILHSLPATRPPCCSLNPASVLCLRAFTFSWPGTDTPMTASGLSSSPLKAFA